MRVSLFPDRSHSEFHLRQALLPDLVPGREAGRALRGRHVSISLSLSLSRSPVLPLPCLCFPGDHADEISPYLERPPDSPVVRLIYFRTSRGHRAR